MQLGRDPGWRLVGLAMLVATALYASTLGRGLVNYDDPWLVQQNWIVQQPSLASLRAIVVDLTQDTRAVLGAEYLPVRDLSIMLDAAVWGESYAGFHLTNLVLYLASIGLWFGVLVGFGVDRKVAGLAMLLWAVHPTHVETVAWISERKGVLALGFAGAAGCAYVRFRAGRSAVWLVLAVIAVLAAVWSKALGAFAVAAIGALELALPAGRVSMRRALAGVGALGIAAVAAMIPVLVVASRMSVVTGEGGAPGGTGWLAMVLGVHGFYVRLAAMTVPNAVSYPISTDGPSTLDIVVGALALVIVLAVVAMPRTRMPAVLRASGLIWLVGWFPVSRLVLPVRLVVAADRYLLLPTLGLALALAYGVIAVPRRRTRIALGVVLAVAGAARSLEAQASWASTAALWTRAVESNPRDGDAWAMLAEATPDPRVADAIIARGLETSASPRLLLHRALLLLRSGDRASAREWMQRAADGGDAVAMANLALMLSDAGQVDAGLDWARRSVASRPLYANGHRMRGKLALALRLHDEAYAAFARAYALEPSSVNRYNLALALIALGRTSEAREHLVGLSVDPALAERARAELAKIGER